MGHYQSMMLLYFVTLPLSNEIMGQMGRKSCWLCLAVINIVLCWTDVRHMSPVAHHVALVTVLSEGRGENSHNSEVNFNLWCVLPELSRIQSMPAIMKIII